MPDPIPPPPALPRAQVAPAAAPAQNSLLLVAVVVAAALYFAREILIPVTIAVLLSFLLAPIVGLLRRARLWRTPAVLLAVILALGVIVGIGGAIGTQIASLVSEVPRYSATIEHKIDAVRGFTIGRINGLIDRLGHQLAGAKAGATPSAAAPVPAQAGSPEQQPIPVEVHQPNPTPLELVSRYLSPALSPFATLGIIFVVAIFVLLQQEDLRDRVIRLVGSGGLARHDGSAGRIAGRGSLDEAAAAMLAQLLGKHGIGARPTSYEAVSRGQIGMLDTRGVAMICISYLEITGNPAHLRYLLERLKYRLPRAPVLVGLWPAEDAVVKDVRLRKELGADYYTSSLHEAVDICVEAA